MLRDNPQEGGSSAFVSPETDELPDRDGLGRANRHAVKELIVGLRLAGLVNSDGTVLRSHTG